MTRVGVSGVVALSLFLLAAFVRHDASAVESYTAKVTVQDVHYTLPAYFRDRELDPKNPLCYAYEYFYMLIKDRELFINGFSRYQAKPGDNVVVRYPDGVFVDGKPAAPPDSPRSWGEEGRPCRPGQ